MHHGTWYTLGTRPHPADTTAHHAPGGILQLDEGGKGGTRRQSVGIAGENAVCHQRGAENAHFGTEAAFEAGKIPAILGGDHSVPLGAMQAAAARQDNCRRAQEQLATLDSGQRIARVKTNGEREYLDDTTRAQEAQRARQVIASDCR